MDTGLYEVLITKKLTEQLNELAENFHSNHIEFRDAEAADRIAFHLSKIIEQTVNTYPQKDRATEGIKLANTLVTAIQQTRSKQPDLSLFSEPGAVLKAITSSLPDGSAKLINEPLIPLLDTTLLTNAPGEPRLSGQLKSEIDSADRIDIVMAFIRYSGISPLLDAMRAHCESGKPLRILTTTYTGTTEGKALDALVSIGADVRISYDISSTRLHAKAWMFARNRISQQHILVHQT